MAQDSKSNWASRCPVSPHFTSSNAHWHYPGGTGGKTNHRDTGFFVALGIARLGNCFSNCVASMLHEPQESSRWALMAGHTQPPCRETQGVIARKLVKAMKGAALLLGVTWGLGSWPRTFCY